MVNKLFENLNPDQKEAVLLFDSPLLIIAGAGSGKTKVITHKIAYLVQKKIYSPFNLLGVTFTNRAANEMKNRIKSLTGIDPNLFNISTFHSLGLRILRESGDALGFDSEWQIIDDRDQKKIIENIIKENFNYFTNDMTESIRAKINSSKMNSVYPNNPDDLYDKGFNEDEIKIFSLYFKFQKKNKVWDYEDLISLTVKLLQNNEDIKLKYNRKFNYVVVDEFQDTNPNQYELIKLIAQKNNKITVVGDDDQAIYSWRGASIRFLFDFENDFPDTKIIKLEQNYRSTKQILDFANNLIDKNLFRRKKIMWTEKKDGNIVYILNSTSKEDEAEKIADLIIKLDQMRPDMLPVAILYRINSQSLAFETEFLRKNIKFKIIKGIRFFDRKEVKDSIALLKLSINLQDNISFLRIIDFLPLGIGPKTLDLLNKKSPEQNLSLFVTLKRFFLEKFQAKALFKKIFDLNKNKNNFSFSEILTLVLNHSNYIDFLKDKGEESKILNINELIDFITKWELINKKGNFTDLLDTMSINSNEKKEKIKEKAYLLTMHNAKGMEFKTVIAAGINSSYMPFFLRKGRLEIEEERRLLYVASTRAINQLIISSGSERVSKFLFDINFKLYKSIYSTDELIYYISHKDVVEVPKLEEKYIKHPIFGRGKIINKINNEKYLIDFADKGEKIIDTSIIKINFL